MAAARYFLKTAAALGLTVPPSLLQNEVIERDIICDMRGLEPRPPAIRVIQRRAYGLRNEEYLRLKILTSMLPAL